MSNVQEKIELIATCDDTIERLRKNGIDDTADSINCFLNIRAKALAQINEMETGTPALPKLYKLYYKIDKEKAVTLKDITDKAEAQQAVRQLAIEKLTELMAERSINAPDKQESYGDYLMFNLRWKFPKLQLKVGAQEIWI